MSVIIRVDQGTQLSLVSAAYKGRESILIAPFVNPSRVQSDDCTKQRSQQSKSISQEQVKLVVAVHVNEIEDCHGYRISLRGVLAVVWLACT